LDHLVGQKAALGHLSRQKISTGAALHGSVAGESNKKDGREGKEKEEKG
jgi:hypothetical protein